MAPPETPVDVLSKIHRKDFEPGEESSKSCTYNEPCKGIKTYFVELFEETWYDVTPVDN